MTLWIIVVLAEANLLWLGQTEAVSHSVAGVPTLPPPSPWCIQLYGHANTKYFNADGTPAQITHTLELDIGMTVKVPKDDGDGYLVFECKQGSSGSGSWAFNHTESCDDKRLSDFSMHDTTCYRIITAEKSFKEALEDCQSIAVNGSTGSRLAFVPNSDVQQFLEKRMEVSSVDSAFIGLRAIGQQETRTFEIFHWTEDGETKAQEIGYAPNGVNVGFSYFCAVISRGHLQWQIVDCNHPKAYICEIRF